MTTMFWVTLAALLALLHSNEDQTQASSAANVRQSISSPRSILCYNCNYCNEVTLETPKIKCAEDMCCYRTAYTEFYRQKFFAHRGCMKVPDTCNKTCEYVEQLHRKKYPNGAFLTCIHCDEGDRDKCNGAKFVLPKHVVPVNRETTSIRCYNCRHCDQVFSITPNIECQHPKCCYSALVNDGGGYYSIRGCAEWNPGGSLCGDDTCDLLRKHRPDSLIQTCMTCNETDGNECNQETYSTLGTSTVAPSIECYSCKGCNTVAATDETIRCTSSECCYRALIKTYENESLSADRGCFKTSPGQTCNNTCNYIKEHNPSKIFVCIQCHHNDVDKCNSKRFNVYTKDARSIMCYSCRNCSVVAADTPMMECRSAKCCYVAFIKDRPNELTYPVRGCTRWRRGRSCRTACRDLTADHLWFHPYGDVVKCIACKNDTDGCNTVSFYFPNVTKVQLPRIDLMNCFECYSCYTVDKYTATVECSSPNCCYTAHIKSSPDEIYNVIRGCGKWDDDNRCNNTCESVTREHPSAQVLKCFTCQIGAPNECNGNYYESPATPQTDMTTPECYQCRDCSQVNPTTARVKCYFLTCCYIVFLRDQKHDRMITVRGCASHYNPCYDTCNKIKRAHLSAHPNGSFDHCMTCNKDDTNMCNQNNYNPSKPATTTPTPAKEVQCYNCTDCNEVNSDTDTISCVHPKCCYILLANGLYQDNLIERGCSTNEACSGTCDYLKQNYKGTLQLCATCDETEGDNCNGNIYTPEDTDTVDI